MLHLIFNDDCMRAFDQLKLKLTTSPIVQPANWALPFELMCDASDKAVGAVLGQRVRKVPHMIYYASRTLDSAQCNYVLQKRRCTLLFLLLKSFVLTCWV